DDANDDRGELEITEAAVIPFFGVGGFQVDFEAFGVFETWIGQQVPPMAGISLPCDGVDAQRYAGGAYAGG
ncbi:MAG TPA: hypothetical protein VIH97_09685, partial [Candidatus Acidoferrales bacterium]